MRCAARSRRARRDADTLSDDVIEESKRLLTLFGVPFIVAPTEAEAQCAQLERAGLVDGTVTEDSDALLFGARHVYRRLFDPKRDVEVFVMDDIERELALSRAQLIDLALLLGSDYTDGVHGVGIVNAMEIIKAFDSLDEFATWTRSWSDDAPRVQQDEAPSEEPATCAEARLAEFKRKHRNIRRSWTLSDGFPSAAVRCERAVSAVVVAAAACIAAAC